MSQIPLETIGKEVGVFALGQLADSLFGSKRATGDLNDFLALIKETGVSSPSLFKVEITPPKGMAEFATYAKTLTLLCDAAALPSLNVMTQDALTYGPSKPIPYNVQYGAVMCSFIVERDLSVKQFFDKWFRTISDPLTYNLNFSDQYATKIVITQLDRAMKEVYSVHLYDAYPTVMNQMDLNYRHTNETHRLQIQFMYKKWVPSGGKFVSQNTSVSGLVEQGLQTFAYKFPKDIISTPI